MKKITLFILHVVVRWELISLRSLVPCAQGGNEEDISYSYVNHVLHNQRQSHMQNWFGLVRR
jgi:hypothetical protein